MEQFDKYKKSKIRWIENIPETWGELRNKNLFRVVKSIVGTNAGDYKVLSLTLRGIVYRDFENKFGKMPKDFEGYQIVETESIILCLFDMDVTPRIVGYSDKNGIVSSAYTVIKSISQSVNPRFYTYWFLAMDITKALLAETKGLRNTLKDSDFLSLTSVYPSISEQNNIVKYLDVKLEQIDIFISQKRKYIELLKEYKQSKINELVTKGLNSKLKLKDSGVDWLGKIPDHWTVKKLKKLTNLIVDGAHLTPTYTDSGVPFLRVTDISAYTNNIDLNKTKYISEEEHNGLRKSNIPEKGDILLSKNGTIGVTKVIDWDWKFSFFVSLCLIKVKKELINPNYLAFSFRTDYLIGQMRDSGKSNTVTNLHLEKIRELLIVIPTMEEQELILNKVNQIDLKYRNLIDKAEKQIDLIQEYRQSLIYESVTGKRKP